MATTIPASSFRAYRPLSARLRALVASPVRHASANARLSPSVTTDSIRQVCTPPSLQGFTRPSSRAFIHPPNARGFSSSVKRDVKAITNPRKDDDGNDMLVHITPRAANRLHAIAEKDNNPSTCLRVTVESGGCHGFQYLMSLTTTDQISQEEDTIFESEDGKSAKVVMDEPSLELLKGSSIDYTMELIGSQFKVTGIPGAKSSCGCGTSFDIQA